MTKINDERLGEQSVPPATELPLSLNNLRLVPQQMLDSRMETVKILNDEENETYRLVKDSQTGEHYLHYAVRHINLAAAGAEEQFHHLMPLEHDDVISLALGAEHYVYPQNWNRAYLRNGPHGGFVWYDPEGASDEGAQYDAIADQIRQKLVAFRQAGRTDEEQLQRLLEQMDRLFQPKPAKEDPSSE